MSGMTDEREHILSKVNDLEAALAHLEHEGQLVADGLQRIGGRSAALESARSLNDEAVAITRTELDRARKTLGGLDC
ncbi:MAG: hypothetical protein CMO26_18515 [Thiotrichales bacterium]|nr:hypothetical protein [Thiotrichales bacterium]